LGDLQRGITAAKAGLSDSKAESHNKILSKLDILRNDKRFEFMLLRDEVVTDSLVSLISRHLRIPDRGKPLSIIDLSGVPSDVVDVVVSVLCRTIFDFALWNPDRQKMPLLLVCEEAHRYAPKKDEATFEPTKLALARIAKEGRKYGVGLFLVSQRPSELSESILSQCNTIIALRMSNEADQHFVSKALPDSVRSLVNALPALRTREGLVVGEGCSVPVRILFDEIPIALRPRSSNVPFAESWKNIDATEAQVTEAVRRWREQDRS
jgi:DNA helicase HerA-like ATPase